MVCEDLSQNLSGCAIKRVTWLSPGPLAVYILAKFPYGAPGV